MVKKVIYICDHCEKEQEKELPAVLKAGDGGFEWSRDLCWSCWSMIDKNLAKSRRDHIHLNKLRW